MRAVNQDGIYELIGLSSGSGGIKDEGLKNFVEKAEPDYTGSVDAVKVCNIIVIINFGPRIAKYCSKQKEPWRAMTKVSVSVVLLIILKHFQFKRLDSQEVTPTVVVVMSGKPMNSEIVDAVVSAEKGLNKTGE